MQKYNKYPYCFVKLLFLYSVYVDFACPLSPFFCLPKGKEQRKGPPSTNRSACRRASQALNFRGI